MTLRQAPGAAHRRQTQTFIAAGLRESMLRPVRMFALPRLRLQIDNLEQIANRQLDIDDVQSPARPHRAVREHIAAEIVDALA
jgi:hypothetical protein